MWYNYLQELSHMIVFPNIKLPPNARLHENAYYCVSLRRKLLRRIEESLASMVLATFIILLLILCTSFPGSEDFVLLITLEANCAYLQIFYALCQLYSQL